MENEDRSYPLQLALRQMEGRQPGPHVLITGGVHGDEFEPMAAIRLLMRRLRPEGLRGRVTLVPVVNEPAFRLGQRTAADRLDLGRTCPGRADGSVTEQIAHALSARIRTADYYIDLHTGGTRLRVLPLVGYSLHRPSRAGRPAAHGPRLRASYHLGDRPDPGG